MDSMKDMSLNTAEIEMNPVEAVQADIIDKNLSAVVTSYEDQPSKPEESEMTSDETTPAGLIEKILVHDVDPNKDQAARPEESEMTSDETTPADLIEKILLHDVHPNEDQAARPEQPEMTSVGAGTADPMEKILSHDVNSTDDEPSGPEESEMTPVGVIPAESIEENLSPADVSGLTTSMASLEMDTDSISLEQTRKQNNDNNEIGKEPLVHDGPVNDCNVLKVQKPPCCEEESSDEDDYDDLSTTLLSIPPNDDFICSPEGNMRHEETDEFPEEDFDEEERSPSVGCKRQDGHSKISHILSNVDVSPTGEKIERVMLPTNSVLETPTYDMVFNYGSEKIAQLSAESNHPVNGFCDAKNVFDYNSSTDGHQGSNSHVETNHAVDQNYVLPNIPMHAMFESSGTQQGVCSHMVNTAAIEPDASSSEESAYDDSSADSSADSSDDSSAESSDDSSDDSSDEEDIQSKLSEKRVNNEIDRYMDHEKRYGSPDPVKDLEISLGLPSSKSVNPDPVNIPTQEVTDGHAIVNGSESDERGRNSQRTTQKRRCDSAEEPYMLALQPEEKVEICNISNDVYQINVVPQAGSSKLRKTETPLNSTQEPTSPAFGFGEEKPISYIVSNHVPGSIPPNLSPQSSPSVAVFSSDEEASCDPPYLSPQVQIENIEQVNSSSAAGYNSVPQYYSSQDPAASGADVTDGNISSVNLSSDYGYGSVPQYYSYEDTAVSPSQSPENAMLAHLPSCNYDFNFGSASVQHTVSLQTQAVSTTSSFSDSNGQMNVHSFHQEWSSTSSFISSQNSSVLPNNMYEQGIVPSSFPINYCQPQPNHYPISNDLRDPSLSSQYTFTQPAISHSDQISYQPNQNAFNAPIRANCNALVTDPSGKTYKPRKSYTQRRPALAVVDGSPTFFMGNNNKTRSYSLPTSQPVSYPRNMPSYNYRSTPYPQRHIWNPNESVPLPSTRSSYYENTMPMNQYNEYSASMMNPWYDYNQPGLCDVFNQVNGPYSVNGYAASAPFYNNPMNGNMESAIDYNMR